MVASMVGFISLSGIALVPLVLAAGEPGKEILYPVATVILGELISTTLLDFFVRPALFWSFGRKASRRYIVLHVDDDLSTPATAPGALGMTHAEIGAPKA
jgi:hypothetical protein